jgi:hypothetical protein
MLDKDSLYAEVEKHIPNFKKDYMIINYNNSKDIILLDKYGYVKTTKHHLIRGQKPTFKKAMNKLEYIKNYIKDYFPKYEEYFKIVGLKEQPVNRGIEIRVIIKDSYGECVSTIGHLKEQKIPGIQSAIDKQKYFLNKLKVKNSYYRNEDFSVMSNYENNKKPIEILTKYGICKVKPSNLLNGDFPTILSAKNKTEYFLNMLKDTQQNTFNKYNFVNFKYIKNNIKSKVYCNIHGDFEITPAVLLRGGGCEQCGYDLLRSFKRNEQETNFSHDSWIRQAKVSKKFDSFKVYIIRCWDEEEEFYKIGKTFLNVRSRYYDCNIPYIYETIKIFESNTEGRYISELEKKLQKLNKENKYTPKKSFNGMYECFKVVNYEL